jgi:predicted ATP-dependent endonuclease of OLD family
MDILALKGSDKAIYTSQIVVTTHSTHILYERGFRPIRYFRRSRAEATSTSDVLNLSVFYDSVDPDVRTFLERYLKLAHCDLFFADAAVLVEGNVERLLLPQMIASAAPRLQSTYLTILEIGGAVRVPVQGVDRVSGPNYSHHNRPRQRVRTRGCSCRRRG